MVEQVQAHLEAVYALQCEARARTFVVDRETASRLGWRGHAEEELLVLEEEGELALALYLAPELLARLEALQGQPPAALVDRALGDFCQLAEGVSHFLYLAHSAQAERTVSLLELEAQAEVDKFVLCLLARWGEGVEGWARQLCVRLFQQVGYRPELSARERWRYEEANRLSHAYCRRLLPLVAGRRLEALLSELRHCYRLGAEAKLRYLAVPH
jgi:hypothetical protein